MNCLACDFTKSKEKYIVNGINVETNEKMQFQLPKFVVIKILESMSETKKLTFTEKIIRFISKVLRQKIKEKEITITFDSKTFKLDINEFFVNF